MRVGMRGTRMTDIDIDNRIQALKYNIEELEGQKLLYIRKIMLLEQLRVNTKNNDALQQTIDNMT
jgi:hypothetical protein